MVNQTNSVFSTGVNGMMRNYDNIARDANTIASASMSPPDGNDTLQDVTTAIVDMNISQHLFDANAKVVKTADELLGTLLDIKS